MAINSLSSSSHGLSGLASGMDTQQMVDAMLAGTQNKIDATSQKKTQLTYKQNLYRELTTKLQTFQNTFFKYATSSTNLMSPSFFNSMTATSTSSAFKVTASSSANAGKATVNYIKQLAQTERSKSNSAVTGKLEGKVDVGALDDILKGFEKEITFKTEGGDAVSVKIRELIGESDVANGSLDIERILKGKLKDVANVSFESGQLLLSSKDGKKMTVSGDTAALKILGLSNTKVSDDEGKLSLAVNPTAALPVLNVTVNGIKKSVTFNPINNLSDPSKKWTAEDFAKRMDSTLKNVFGNKVEARANGDKIEFLMTDGTKDASGKSNYDRTSQITIAGETASGSNVLMKAFGIASGKSNKIGTGMTLAEANFAEPIAGGMHKFTINGVDFSVDSNRSIYSVMDEINNSNAGVKISYQSTEDKFVIESKTEGALAGDAFKMSQTEGNLLTAMFGVGRSDSASTNAITGPGFIKGTEIDNKKVDFTDTTVKLNIDGKEYSFDVKFGEKDTKDATTFLRKLNTAIAENKDTKGKVSFGYEVAENKGTVRMNAGKGVEVAVVDGLDSMGLEDGKRTYAGIAKPGTTLEALGLKDLVMNIGGFEVKAEANDTVATFEERLNTATKRAAGEAAGEAAKNAAIAAGKTADEADQLGAQADLAAQAKAGAEFDKNTGRYRMFGVDIPISIQASGDENRVMGTDQPVTVGKSADIALQKVQEGQNAVAKINGVVMERASNIFSVDGLTFELRNTTEGANDATPKEVNESIEISRDTDKIYDGLTKFMEEYNKLVDSINEQLDADPNYRKYPPLTDAQKQSMSDREVELWESKSKEGLLRNDSTLETVMRGLRETLYTKPVGGVALYELGIQPNSYYGEKDHLTIDDPAKLKQRIAENPNAVQALFTDAEKGLSQMLNSAIDRAASTNSGSPGLLVREAGSTGRTDTASNIYKQVRDLDKRLDNLEDTYTAQYKRYWKQFNSMEQMISQMNSQSSWLTQQFS